MAHHISLNVINGVKISTILIDGQYETCVFDSRGSNVIGYYATESDAIAGHNRIVTEFWDLVNS